MLICILCGSLAIILLIFTILVGVLDVIWLDEYSGIVLSAIIAVLAVASLVMGLIGAGNKRTEDGVKEVELERATLVYQLENFSYYESVVSDVKSFNKKIDNIKNKDNIWIGWFVDKNYEGLEKIEYTIYVSTSK